MVSLALAASAWTTLVYVPARPDNPLKGLVPYAGSGLERFPQSMEFDYLSLADLVAGEKKYDWGPLDRLIERVASRGNQLVFRVYSEYPGKPDAVPRHLAEQGVKITRWTSEGAQDKTKPDVATPDYRDERFQKCVLEFIAALGARYDGDPRIGFITAGLLGLWGEWHNWPREEELFAPVSFQAKVMEAYESAFRKTKVLFRYPRDGSNPRYAANHLRPFGYHDDSFAYATLETGRAEDSWHFMAALKSAGPGALDKWKTQPIGGEIRPEVWGKIFDVQPDLKEFQDFASCVKATKASWLMDSGLFDDAPSPERKQRAIEQVQRMGYELHVSGWRVVPSGGRDIFEFRIENRGVAPFYYNWPVEAALFDPAGKTVQAVAVEGGIHGVLPGTAFRTLSAQFAKRPKPGRGWRVGIRVPNPMKGGKALRFANKLEGDWLMISLAPAP